MDDSNSHYGRFGPRRVRAPGLHLPQNRPLVGRVPSPGVSIWSIMRTFSALSAFSAVNPPHFHSGIGIRPFGRYLEVRAGLDLRVLFFTDEGDLFLVCVDNHDELRPYVKNKPKP